MKTERDHTRTRAWPKGILMGQVHDHCPCCKVCWIYLESPMKGMCKYGGPYDGYEKMPD